MKLKCLVIGLALLVFISCGTVYSPKECNQLFTNSNYACEDYCTKDDCEKICKDSAVIQNDKCLAGEKISTSKYTLMAESAPGLAIYAATSALTGIGIGYKKEIPTYYLKYPSVHL